MQSIVEFEDVPWDLIFSWDQTGLNNVPVSNWTIEKEGAKCVEIKDLDDKRQITAVFGATVTSEFFTSATCVPRQANAIPTSNFLKIGALLILIITGAMKQLWLTTSWRLSFFLSSRSIGNLRHLMIKLHLQYLMSSRGRKLRHVVNCSGKTISFLSMLHRIAQINYSPSISAQTSMPKIFLSENFKNGTKNKYWSSWSKVL